MDEAPSKTGRAQKARGLIQTADPHQHKTFGRMRETARAAADPGRLTHEGYPRLSNSAIVDHGGGRLGNDPSSMAFENEQSVTSRRMLTAMPQGYLHTCRANPPW